MARTQQQQQQAVVSPPRRITRSSLARFAYTADGASTKASSSDLDIEDIIPDIPSSSSTSVPLKRKRTTSNKPATRKAKTPSLETKIEDEYEEEEEEEEEETKASKRSYRKPLVSQTPSESKTTPPPNWEKIYALVKEMRENPDGAAANAPVDTMGCERLANPKSSARDQRFQTLIALMLSSQTKDTTNALAMSRLQNELPSHNGTSPPGLTLENILAVPAPKLNDLIRAVGFHNNKTRYIQQAASICRDKYNSDIPSTIDGLVSLPGVGPKMAHLCLSAAWGRTEGIGVDVHVHRLTNLWRWHATRNPEDTRKRLEAWLPRDKWREINTLLVGFGQTVCLPVGRRCGDCKLGLAGLCPAAERKKVVEGRRVREELEVEGKGFVVEVAKEETVEVEREVVVNQGVGVGVKGEEMQVMEEEGAKPIQKEEAVEKEVTVKMEKTVQTEKAAKKEKVVKQEDVIKIEETGDVKLIKTVETEEAFKQEEVDDVKLLNNKTIKREKKDEVIKKEDVDDVKLIKEEDLGV